MTRITFVGGVHGVGKTAMCAELAKRVDATHYIASSLIREAQNDAISQETKRAKDVPGNQELLRSRFCSLVAKNSDPIILDGHYTIIDSKGEPVPLPPELFASLGVSKFICVRGDSTSISERLRLRDGVGPSQADVELLQSAEIAQAEIVSEKLSASLIVVEAFDIESFLIAYRKN